MKRNLKSRLTIFKLMLFFLFFFFPSRNLYAETVISKVFPKPQQMEAKKLDVIIDKDWSIVFDRKNEKILFSGRYLAEEISKNYRLSLFLEDITKKSKKKNIYLISSKDNNFKDIILPREIAEEGYLLDINSDSIIIKANTPKGIFYGIQTLIQLFKKNAEKLTLPAFRIIDYPKVKIRGVHFNAANLDLLKEQLDIIASYKMNTAVIENWAFFDLYKGDNLNKLEEIFKYARDRFIEPIPEIVSFSHAAPIFLKNPYTAEGIYTKDAHFIFKNDFATPVSSKTPSLTNIIRENNSDIVITNLEKTEVYQENRDYIIIDGVISYPYDLHNQPLRIKRLITGKIKENQEVLISFDCVRNIQTSWVKWSIPYCPFSEFTYEIMRETFEKVIKHLSPNYISIGHDEIIGINRDSRCQRQNMSNAEIVAYDIKELHDIVKQLDPEVTLMMWDDMLNPWHNGGDEFYQIPFEGKIGKTAPAINLIPNDILMMVWWYESNDKLKKMINSPSYFKSKGFDYLVAAWNEKENIKEWIKIIVEQGNSEGLIITTWKGFQKNLENIKFTADISWRGN